MRTSVTVERAARRADGVQEWEEIKFSVDGHYLKVGGDCVAPQGGRGGNEPSRFPELR